MWEQHENDRGGGRFKRELRSGGLLVYQVEGDMSEMSALPWALFQTVPRDVAELSPKNIAFDLTWADSFYGSPIGFLTQARRCVHPGGDAYLVLGVEHSPSVRRILEICRVIPVADKTGLYRCLESIKAVEDALEPEPPDQNSQESLPYPCASSRFDRKGGSGGPVLGVPDRQISN